MLVPHVYVHLCISNAEYFLRATLHQMTLSPAHYPATPSTHRFRHAAVGNDRDAVHLFAGTLVFVLRASDLVRGVVMGVVPESKVICVVCTSDDAWILTVLLTAVANGKTLSKSTQAALADVSKGILLRK